MSEKLDAFSAVLQSPVGGWVMACVVVAGMAWVTFKDRQIVYKEMVQLREKAIPTVEENNRMLKEIIQLLKDKP